MGNSDSRLYDNPVLRTFINIHLRRGRWCCRILLEVDAAMDSLPPMLCNRNASLPYILWSNAILQRNRLHTHFWSSPHWWNAIRNSYFPSSRGGTDTAYHLGEGDTSSSGNSIARLLYNANNCEGNIRCRLPRSQHRASLHLRCPPRRHSTC